MAVIEGKGDYLLSVKDNRQTLKEDIEGYVQDKHLRKTMDSFTTIEKTRGRVERRTAYASSEIGWLSGKEEWKGLACIGALNTQFSSKKGETNEWHYYINSRNLKAQELLRHARLEWSVETMHWLLDVHFGEDSCRVEDRNVQQNLNIVRKVALNTIKGYKNKDNESAINFECRQPAFADTPSVRTCRQHRRCRICASRRGNPSSPQNVRDLRMSRRT